MNRFLPVCLLFLFSSALAEQPNILLILADDLGYGDVGCYNEESRVPTPHLDKLAADGIRFTDAHSPSTVCTPTRYGILTGRMPFRNGVPGVFTGVGGPCLIEEDRLTLPELLRQQGYATWMSGKWHIGLTMFDDEGKPIHKNGLEAVQRIDYTRAIPDGPVHRGFERFFGTACCPTTDWLYAWIVDDRIPVPPVKILDRSTLPDHPYAFDCRPGMIAPDFQMEGVDQVFLEKSQDFLRQHARDGAEKPFFLFHSMQAVHLPSFPAKSMQGKTDAGPHGDFIFEADFVVGQLLQTLDELNLTENTLVIFTSDNGPEVGTTWHMRNDWNHDGARPWRGVKRDNWEGGHRVPFLARWPGKIPAGSESTQTICLTDLFATTAAIVDFELPENAAEDSFDLLPTFLGTATAPIREYTLHQTIQLKLAIRKGPWKYLDHEGSGGNSYDRKFTSDWKLPNTDPGAPGQLFHLENDPGETTNLYSQHPEIVAELKAKLEELIRVGRSR